ncbi:hypothetical protein CBI55_20500 [Pseudomonas syringae]|nr:hypothetical protein CBI55_20500 [Pseudomonas syringae]POP77574.1 hypothetical protein CXB38_23155 [Pseudomonas syringae]
MRNDHLNYRAALCVVNCIPAGACGTIIPRLSCGALRRMPFRTLRVLLTTQSVLNCIPTL